MTSEDLHNQLVSLVKEMRHRFPGMGFIIMVSDFENYTRFGSNLNLDSQLAMLEVGMKAIQEQGVEDFKYHEEGTVN